MFYFLRKIQKFSKKGLEVSICTHMAHSKFCFAGSVVKIVKILGFVWLPWSVPVGCKYCPQALFKHLSGGLTIQDAFPDHLGWFLKFCFSAIFCPKMASNTPKWGVCRNFCRYFEGHGHSTDVRTYLILCGGVYQVYLMNFNPLTSGCAPHCGVRVAETPKTPNFGRKSRYCRNFA